MIIINSEYAALARIKGFLFTNVITGILIAFLIGINLFQNKSIVYKILNNGLVVFVGKLSYSIYVWQQIFTFSIPWAGSSKLLSAVGFNLSVLLVVAYLSYNYFEKPFLKLKQKFQIKKNIPVGQGL
ncbi:MAG: hypothetical protein EOP42_25580 [Sphingobacteriaceae bacterium]|nr:MAG: hypothetical protein EOP42_25580 [Sphingobacteriaceae bacterium]